MLPDATPVYQEAKHFLETIAGRFLLVNDLTITLYRDTIVLYRDIIVILILISFIPLIYIQNSYLLKDHVVS